MSVYHLREMISFWYCWKHKQCFRGGLDGQKRKSTSYPWQYGLLGRGAQMRGRKTPFYHSTCLQYVLWTQRLTNSGGGCRTT